MDVCYRLNLFSGIQRPLNYFSKLFSFCRQFSKCCSWCNCFKTQVLRRCNLSKTFGQFATANYNFYTFVKEGFVFLVMVDAGVGIFSLSIKPGSLLAFWRRFKKNFSTLTTSRKETQLSRILWRTLTMCLKIIWLSIAIKLKLISSLN